MSGCLILQMSTRSNLAWKLSIQEVTSFLLVNILVFLSSSGLSGQFKSPPKTIFSSESRFSFVKIESKLSKKLHQFLVFVWRIDSYQYIKFLLDLSFKNNVAPQRIQDLTVVGAVNPIFIKISTPHELEPLWQVIVSALHSFFHWFSVAGGMCFLKKKNLHYVFGTRRKWFFFYGNHSNPLHLAKLTQNNWSIQSTLRQWNGRNKKITQVGKKQGCVEAYFIISHLYLHNCFIACKVLYSHDA